MATWRHAAGLALAGALSLGGAEARADLKPDEKKAPDAQGSGTDAKKAAEGENPAKALADIVKLMKDVEQRLAETDTDSWTQAEQEKVVKALDLEGQSVEKLQKLIDQLIDQANSSSSGGGGGEGGKKPSGSGGKPPGQGKTRGQDEGQKPLDPNAGKDPGQKDGQKDGQEKGKKPKGEKNDQEGQNDKTVEGQTPPAEGGPLQKAPGAANAASWGTLPPKQAREVLDAQNREKPQEWRKAIEDYLKKLQGPRR